MRLFKITLPEDKVSKVMHFLEDEKAISNIAKIHGSGMMFVLFFRVSNSQSRLLMTALEEIGVGFEYGLIDVIPIEASKPYHEEISHIVQKASAHDNLPVEQIYANITSGAVLSFDYISMIIVAGVVGVTGLATNSVVAVIASMIISPLLGPILATSLALIIRDRKLLYLGLATQTVGIFCSIVVGLLFGFICFPLGKKDFLNWPSQEMSVRGELSGLIASPVIAASCGVGVAIAVTKGQTGGLIGVSIAAALIPPAVNTGLCFAYAWMGPLVEDSVDRLNMLRIALFSFVLLIVNIFLIIVVSMITFRIKALKPFVRSSAAWTELPDLDKTTRRELYHQTLTVDEQDSIQSDLSQQQHNRQQQQQQQQTIYNKENNNNNEGNNDNNNNQPISSSSLSKSSRVKTKKREFPHVSEIFQHLSIENKMHNNNIKNNNKNEKETIVDLEEND